MSTEQKKGCYENPLEKKNSYHVKYYSYMPKTLPQ